MTLMPVSKISGAVTRSVNGGGARWMGSFTCALTSPRLSTGSPSTFRSRPRQGFPTDRKSTRLNSSHSQISYAVFCLKKKNELIDVDGKGHTHECRTCGFLVNETCMVDAGSVSAGLQEAEQGKIRHVLLSHAHLDHIKGLPLLADNLAGRAQDGPGKVTRSSEALDSLR